jgi:hypothetical protein
MRARKLRVLEFGPIWDSTSKWRWWEWWTDPLFQRPYPPFEKYPPYIPFEYWEPGCGMMTLLPCPHCHHEPWGIAMGPPDLFANSEEIKCGYCGYCVGMAVCPREPTPLGKYAMDHWNALVMRGANRGG